MFHFANILFSGRCNLHCPYCIGQNAMLRQLPDNLRIFPPKGLDRFVDLLVAHAVTQISLTGTNTDPQLYAYEAELIVYLRNRIPNVELSLHTNGQLALKKIDSFNLYDKATISLPSFEPATYQALTGSSRMIDLAAIVRVARIPLKISTILTSQNIDQIPDIVERCCQLQIPRLVLRKQYSDARQWPLFPNHTPVRYFGNNPVYDIDGLEVTVWDFAASTVQCLNLFSHGTINSEYQVAAQQSSKI
jgi:molybdenum cofactor biosynthesis enzyme MoaA